MSFEVAWHAYVADLAKLPAGKLVEVSAHGPLLVDLAGQHDQPAVSAELDRVELLVHRAPAADGARQEGHCAGREINGGSRHAERAAAPGCQHKMTREVG